MSIESITIGMLEPVLVKGIPFLVRKFLVADVKPIPQRLVPIRVCNGVAYGSFAFSVYNKRLAKFYNKYSIPFLDYFKTEPKWRVSNPKYGEINSKNHLILHLDNIPRNQTVIVIVDTECKVDPKQYLRIRCDPPQGILSHENPETMVEIINTRDFQILGFRAEIKTRCGDKSRFEIKFIQPHPRKSIIYPQEFINLAFDHRGEEKTVSWEIDLQGGEIKRYTIKLLPNNLN